MKITHATTHLVNLPTDNPLVVGLPPRNDMREFVTVELGTDDGLVGLGLTFFGGAISPALKSAVANGEQKAQATKDTSCGVSRVSQVVPSSVERSTPSSVVASTVPVPGAIARAAGAEGIARVFQVRPSVLVRS